MSEQELTPLTTRTEILADLWLNYRNDEEFTDFIEYNDLGLPLSYAVAEGIIKSTPVADAFINETFDLLLSALDIEDDGYDALDAMLAASLDN